MSRVLPIRNERLSVDSEMTRTYDTHQNDEDKNKPELTFEVAKQSRTQTIITNNSKNKPKATIRQIT